MEGINTTWFGNANIFNWTATVVIVNRRQDWPTNQTYSLEFDLTKWPPSMDFGKVYINVVLPILAVIICGIYCYYRYLSVHVRKWED